MPYIDGVVLAVPATNKQAYIKHAKQAAAVFKKNGALSVVECWGDEVPDGEVTSFPMAVKCAGDEVVCFSWVMWPSKTVRDAGMQKSMQDPVFQPDTCAIPFDGQRMIFGGFEVVVNE